MLWPNGIAACSHFEYGGCERLGGKYYLIGGYANIAGFAGYSMFTLVADDPRGPFRPDVEAFRLCGSSRQNVTWLAAWCRGNGELLVSNYASTTPDDRDPGFYHCGKPTIDSQGHLRLAWWPGNEALKGQALLLNQRSLQVRGANANETYQRVWLDTTCDLRTGVILEGTLCGRISGRQPAAGFVLDEGNDQSLAVLLGIGAPKGRQTEIGRLRDADGNWQFSAEDVTGEYSATSTGLDADGRHRFRLLMRLGLFELYLDDRLMQTYAYRPATGRLGFVVRDADLQVDDLAAWQMSLPPEKSFAVYTPRDPRSATRPSWRG